MRSHPEHSDTGARAGRDSDAAAVHEGEDNAMRFWKHFYVVFVTIAFLSAMGCGDKNDALPCDGGPACSSDARPPEPEPEPEPEPNPACIFELPPGFEAGSDTIDLPTEQLITVAGNLEPLGIGFFAEDGSLLDVPMSEFSATTTNEAIATVATGVHAVASGPAPYLLVTAKEAGAAEVEVTQGGHVRRMPVTVLESIVADISLPETQAAFDAGKIAKADVFFYHECGHWIGFPEFELISSDPEVLVAYPRQTPDTGRAYIELRGAGAGVTALTVAANGHTATLQVEVAPTPISRISMPSSSSLEEECTIETDLEFEDLNGDDILLVPEYVNLSTSDPNVVNPVFLTYDDGYIAGLALTAGVPGTATITVAAGGATAAMTVTVLPSNLGCDDGEEEEEEEEEEENEPGEENPDEHYFYFSYDDSASTAAVEQVKYQLREGITPERTLAREWEFLNYESFVPEASESLGLFDVSMGMVQRPSTSQEGKTDYLLGVHVASPVIDKNLRQNAVLTLVVDVSGSMGWGGPRVDADNITRFDIAKLGLQSMVDALKPGDIVNLVTFDEEAQVELEHQAYTESDPDFRKLRRAIQRLTTRDSYTDLNKGLTVAYRIARRNYDPTKINRVILLTDAYANIEELDAVVVAENVVVGNAQGIFFSGIGVGDNFNDAFLNTLTDIGRGGYFALITRSDAVRMFRDRFIALLAVAAKNVLFRLDYPAVMTHTSSASEESSGDPADVQPTNFSFNTAQYFFETFNAPDEADVFARRFKLTIFYIDPGTGTTQMKTIERTVGEMLGRHESNLLAAELIHILNRLIRDEMSAADANVVIASHPSGYRGTLYEEYLELIQRYITLSPL